MLGEGGSDLTEAEVSAMKEHITELETTNQVCLCLFSFISPFHLSPPSINRICSIFFFFFFFFFFLNPIADINKCLV